MHGPSHGGVEVAISGPGHHERAARAGQVVAAIVALGVEVRVTTDLRPRLADDIRSLLDAGASEVRLEADGMVGDFVAAPGAELHDPPDDRVLIVLRAGPRLPAVVKGESDLAVRIRAVVDALRDADDASG
jgi:hypothetical protein